MLWIYKKVDDLTLTSSNIHYNDVDNDGLSYDHLIHYQYKYNELNLNIFYFAKEKTHWKSLILSQVFNSLLC